ncbi:MAG: CoA transferase [Dehalococcoidia bacterium]|jgi:formyl-CoA transferase|nr:CoA transferase [Dehalococcoidia bacterium]MDP7239625.1 CoA transferase [Dehalococcoidia bacterium]MDP7470706.1 CoA transferase [Dehalococcoidia bacterium]
MKSVLEGIRVLEWAAYHVGPHAASILGDLGADVIKIEEKERGDPFRGYKRIMGIPAVSPEGVNLLFENHNRSKRAISIDLKKTRGREVVYRLVGNADVFLTNFRVEPANRLGMDYETLKQHNKELIYAGASGFGPQGPDCFSPAFDMVGQARAGIMLAQKSSEEEPFSITGLGDQMGAITTAFGVLAALIGRERLGIGQQVNSSLLGSMMWLQATNVAFSLSTGQELTRRERKKAVSALLNVYQASDEKWICLGMGPLADRYWPSLCRALDMQELENDPRFDCLENKEKNSEELVAILDNVFAQRPREEWLRVLKHWDLVASPVNTISDLPDDTQVQENDYIIDYDHPVLGKVKELGFPVRLTETPARVSSCAPAHGQHTEEVLLDIAGYSWNEIGELKDEGVI